MASTTAVPLRPSLPETSLSYGQQRDDPIVKSPTQPAKDPAHSAAIIFLHGLDDDAHGWEDIANQFQRHNKLPYVQWIFPNAPHNHDARQTAWYTPTSLAPTPAGRPELAEEEDEHGLRKSVRYVESLLDDLCSKGVPPNRIVLAGFSQGCALSLLTELTSYYSGRLAGIAGLMGYLPLPDKIEAMRSQANMPPEVDGVPLFLARGSKDRLIPYSKWNETLTNLKQLGFGASLEVKDYQDLGHSLSPVVLQDLLIWLEKCVPKLEG